jgi:hypothetical protein
MIDGSLRRVLAGIVAVTFTTATLGASAAPPPPAPPPATVPAAQPQPPAQPPVAQPPVDPNAPPPPGYGQPPPPGYGPPPTVYYAPQPGYGPPGYYPPPAAPQGPYVIEDWEEGDPIPDGYQPESRIRKGLVIGGAVTLGALWVLTIVIAAAGQSIEATDDELTTAVGGDPEADGRTEGDWAVLYIPVAGPFVGIATLDASGGGLAILIIDGVAQTGGLAMLIAGLAAQETRLVRIGGAEITVTPEVGPNQTGLGVHGRF